MPRGKPPEGITIGFLGTGEMEADPATDLIEEFINESIKPEEPAIFIFPLTQDEFSDTMGSLADMARKSKIRYEVITNSEDKKRRAFTTVVQSASNQYLATDVFTQMETILVEAPQSVLMVLWDEKRDDELQAIVGKFIDAGVRVMDLTNGLALLGVEEEGQEGEGPEDEDEDEDEDEGTDEAEAVAELEAEAAGEGYIRSEMEKMTHAQVKEIAVGMGLAPRKARENMILAILEAQGESVAVPEGAVDTDAATIVTTELIATEANWDGLKEILDEFGSRFMEGLDDWLTKFSTAAEGFAFNTSPEEPMPVEEAPAPVRRLSRTPR